ncbi:MAG: phosphatidylglycerophosphatase A [Candidatus Kapabacteria bacterium]|nr:phosphatidylglycerophosphatase A [Candidatus Kapabacteria bacterium]
MMAHEMTVRPTLSTPAAIIATVGGIGLLPIAPGTWCSFIVALPVALFPMFGIDVNPDTWRQIYMGLTVFFTIGAAWSVPAIQRQWGSDPKCVVIDEAIGMSMIMMLPFAYHTIWWWLAGVLLFRVFDVQKPWPLSAVNRRTEAWAVIVDDVLAAVFTIIALYLMMLAVQVVVLGFAVS